MPLSFLPTNHSNTENFPLYLTSIGYDYVEKTVERPQGYNDFQWLHTASGQGALLLEGKTYTLDEGSGVLLFPDVPHHYHPLTDDWHTEWLTFNGKTAGAILHGFGHTKSGLYSLRDRTPLSLAIKKGYQLSVSKGEFLPLDIAGYIFDFFITMGKVAVPFKQPKVSGHYDKIAPVLAYLETHYHEPTDLNALAAMVQISPQYLCTLFKKVTGTRPALYINHLRLNKAKALMLIHPEMTIAHIAGVVGFDSPSYFSALFKKYEHQTPGAFIARHRS